MPGLKRMPSRFARPMAKVTALPKKAEPFYLSSAWRDLVARLKRERGNWCEKCGSPKRIIGDHKVERKDGGADLDPANVELLCHACHQRKTAEARKARVTGGRSKV